MGKKWLRLILPMALVLLLSGCLFQAPDDLYKLPEMSAGYDQLNTAIKAARGELEAEFNTKTEVAVIVSGDNTATIQLQDLDGDGERESAVAFIRVPSIEKPLKIYIFTHAGEDYQLTGVVEGDGSAIYSVDYVDLNGEGRKELVVSWQISTGVYQLGAYTLDELDEPVSEPANTVYRDNNMQYVDRTTVLATELLLTGCSAASDSASGYSSGYRLIDIDQDMQTEIAVTRIESAGVGSQVEVYGWSDGALVSLSSAKLSAGAISLNRMRSNYLSGEYYTPSLYIICDLDDGGKSIDVLTFREGKLINIALDAKTGMSRNQLQGYTEVNLTDVNGDYVLEIPYPRLLPSYEEQSSSNFWLIDWSQYDDTGDCNQVLTTYHNVTDSWYLVIPDEWKDQLIISRNDSLSGQREVIFSQWRGDDLSPTPFLSVYRLTGNNRVSRSAEGERFVLREEGLIIYAAEFYENSWDCGLSKTDLLENFNTIQASWYSD